MMENRRSFLSRSAGVLMGAHLLQADDLPGGAAAGGGAEAVARVGIAHDPLCLEHQTGAGHPERPERYEAVMGGLEKSGLLRRLVPIDSRDATEEEILACHDAGYVQRARAEVEAGRGELSTGDTRISRRSWDCAKRAAGNVCAAVDAVMEGKVKRAFCAVRPPGHHATGSRGMGFCLLNNIAIGARHAQKKHRVERVLIVDWDVHHGNGTQDIFYEDGSVFFFSVHQHPWYPGTGMSDETGAGRGVGATMNWPVRAGSGRREVFEGFERLLEAMNGFKPQLILISAGFDSRENDPLGELRLTDGDFADLTRMLKKLAAQDAQGRVVSVLEGGYSLGGLASGVRAHVEVLLE